MKHLIIILISFLLCLNLSAQSVYYVDPNGDDEADGAIGTPFATWQHAIDVAITPGDTVFFRDGVWILGAGEKVTIDPTGSLSGAGIHGDSGTYDNHIVYMAYEDEVPILDASNTTSFEESFEVWGTTYVEFIGLTFRGKPQDSWNQIIRQAVFYQNGTIWIDQCVSDSSGGYGFTINAWDTLYLTNCDSYEHYNPLSDDPGNKPDGFSISSGGETTDYGYVQGCRAWRCSDDGFELSWKAVMIADSLWSFCNGYGTGGAGVGIKYGEGFIEDSANRITKHCISAYNRAWGFAFQNLYTADDGPIGNFYNNLSYEDEGGIQSVISSYFTDCDAGDTYLNFRNNIIYKVSNKVLNLVTCSYSIIDSKWWESNNTWVFADNSYKYIDNSALSWSNDGEDAQWNLLPDSATTLTIMSAARKADGSLPDIGGYFKLDESSVLIDAGIDVGLPYTGAEPDLGPFEYGEYEPLTGTDILTFSLSEQTGEATISPHTVSIEVPCGQSVTALEPTITVSPAASIDPLSGAAQNFTNPVVYTVTAEDLTEQEWTVTVTVSTSHISPELIYEDGNIITEGGYIIIKE